nr:hypothetical protein [Tanacetum cinerariifolium]
MVGHPNGTLAKITHVGNLKLDNDVVLFDVLVVTKCCVILLYVHKLIKDKLIVGFEETKCYIQDLRKGRILMIVSEFGGLYMFDNEYNKFAYVNQMYGREPDLSHLRSFGCLCYAAIVKGSDKFSSKSKNCILIGPNDEEEGASGSKECGMHQPITESGHSGNDVHLHQPGLDNTTIQSRYDELHTATLVEELTDNPIGRKPIGSKWVFRIKYKSTGEVERSKARLVAKGFNQREGIDYEETFSPMVKMGTVRCLINLIVQKDQSPLPENIVLAHKETDDDKYCVFVNGCLVSWKSKKQATLSKSLVEAKYRTMASATCEVMWILKVLKDLGLNGLDPDTLFCENKFAIQIAANPVMHEKTKHFDIDVHIVREKVALGLIKTKKVDSKSQIADILTKVEGGGSYGNVSYKSSLADLRSKQPFILEESPIDTMADQRTMAELLRTPTEGYAEATMVPPILADQFELKYSLINVMTTDQFFGLENDNPHDHIRAGRRWLEKEPPHSIHTWEDLDRYKDLLRACPDHGFTELHQLDTFYNALNPADQDSLYAAVGGNLLEIHTQDVLTIIKNKSKVRNSRNKSVVSQVKSCDASFNSSEIAKLTHAVNQQTSAVTTAMTAILKQFKATPPPAPVKAVEEICVTCGGAHPYYQCLATGMANQIRPPGFAQPNVQNNQNRFGQPQGFNHGNNFNPEQSYQASTQQNQIVPLNELEKVKRMNEANMKAMQTQINMVKNELRNEMKILIQASLSNQTNEIKNMMASLLQMNTASTSGSGYIPSNTVANPKGKLKAITTQSVIVLDGPTVPIPPTITNPEEDERVKETLTDSNLTEYTIKVPPPPVQKYKPPKCLKLSFSTRRNFKNWQTHLLMKIAQRLSLKSYPKNIETLGNFSFRVVSVCKALADLGASINLMPLSVWKKLGLPELISTRMTLELANRSIRTPAGIVRDVFVSIGKFTFPADFVIVDYESDPRVPLILGRPFLRTARALIDVHGEEMILHDGDERLTLNMRHDTSSYSNQPHKESINLINVFNNSKGGNVLPEKLLDLNSTKDLHPPLHVNPLSGSTTYSYSSNSLLEEFVDELALITFPLKYDDDLQFDVDQENPFEIITRVVQDKKLAISNASLVLENLDPPSYEPLFFKEVPRTISSRL